MSQSTPHTAPTEPHVRTPEQHDAVRRRSLPLALSGLILGIVGLVLLLSKDVGVHHPPNVIAANLSFCAMMIAVGILFYAKGTPGTAPARILCLLALLTGLVGPFVFARQTIAWRKGTEGRELENVAAIAQAAKTYAASHEGHYPASLAVLLNDKLITPDTLLSPFAGTQPLPEDVSALRARLKEPDVLSAIDAHSDFTYAGGDLLTPPGQTLSPDILVSYAKAPVMRKHLAVAYTDGHAEFITLDQAEAALAKTNAARLALGLPKMQRPASVEKALEEASSQPTP